MAAHTVAAAGASDTARGLLTALGVMACATGCGVQLDAAAHTPGPSTFPFSGTLSGRAVSPTGSGFYAGAHTTLTDPDHDGDEGDFGFRHLVVGAGPRFVDGLVGLEAGLEAGVGEPAYQNYDAVGLYGGLSGAFMVRAWGKQDVEPGFAAGGLLVDVVLSTRGGVWTPPASRPELDERWVHSAHVGWRFTILSDLLDAGGEELDK